jgi:hypothetical protein
MHSRSGLWHAQNTTIQIHRAATVEEYSIPTPQEVFENEDFELVKAHALQNALAWMDSEESPEHLSGKIQVDVETVIEQ